MTIESEKNAPTARATLADAQPGGRVMLGNAQEHAKNLDLLRTGYHVDYKPRTEALDAAIAALSAQPSLGGQGEYVQGSDDLRARTDGERAAYLEGLEEGKKVATRQPVGEPVAFQLAGSEPLWCLHVLGMDDVHPAPSKAHAEKAAAWHNEQFKDQAARLGISIEAKVVPWPHSAESHADGVAEFIPQWLIPQWQLDALEVNAKQPAQAVDLGTGVAAIADERQRQLQAEGFTREKDQQYRRGELAKAATAYVQLAAMDLEAGTRNHIAWCEPAAVWPWAPEWWKPVDARRDLVRAGALIAAQIDLIDSQAVGNG